MAAINDCFTCNQSNKKRKSSVICTGCQKSFCKEHHQEHRKIIDKDFEGLIEQHNIVRQSLYSENNGENNRTSNLLKIIDDWEKEMIANIKTTAAANKTRLNQIINEEKDQLKNKFKLMADELKTNQSNSDYVELDIQEWQKQLSECKQKLEQLQTWNNDFISIDIKSIDWKNGINIQQKKEVHIRTVNRPVQSNRSKQRQLTCSDCGKSFYEDFGYDKEFCSVNCLTNHQSRFSQNHDSDSDDEGTCFHGNCVVSLANGLNKLVKDIRKGDIVKTPDGSKATVTYAIKILCRNNRTTMVSFDNGLIITPWHPIRINGKWVFPHDIGDETVIECQEVYNFVLDSGHIMFINGIECVTLGHGFKGEVIEHPYYGTNQVLDDLRAIDVCNNGFIELLPNSTVRDRKTGLVSGIRRCTTISNPEQLPTLSISVQ
jgi:hypothetical protein